MGDVRPEIYEVAAGTLYSKAKPVIPPVRGRFRDPDASPVADQ
jgi:hypothetical protein